jgi:hypothetical protein
MSEQWLEHERDGYGARQKENKEWVVTKINDSGV